LSATGFDCRSGLDFQGVKWMGGDELGVDHSALDADLSPLRILLVDDDHLLRQAVRSILTQAGMTVVGEATNGRDALTMTRYYKPDVVLLDVVMPSMDGLTALDHMTNDDSITSHVVMFSVHGDHDIAFVALRKGALGYVDKEHDLAALPRVLRDAAGGTAALSRSLATHLVKRLRELPEGGVGMRPIQSVLTAREWEVADLLSLGHTTDEVADALVLTTETVRTHIKNIMRKLGVHRRVDLIETVERLRSGLVLGNARPDEPAGPDRARAPIFSRSGA
jgi:DNA-binding NarL/FixJ family response regulator